MICSEAQHLIHLDAGGDLRTDERQRLASHLETCSGCGSYRDRMMSAMLALTSLRDAVEQPAETGTVRSSVWPSVRFELGRRKLRPASARRFNLSVAALSVCSLSLAVISIVQTMSSWGFQDLNSGRMGISIPAGLSAPLPAIANDKSTVVEDSPKSPTDANSSAPGLNKF
jgi:anti-sigma factor RsiW